MTIKDYLTFIPTMNYRNPRLYGSAVIVESGGRQMGLASLIADHVDRSDRNLLDVMTAIGGGMYFGMRRSNKRSRWIRKLVLRKLELAK